ncbi:CU044_2847 family protein [Streptomyces sp. ND04-05B]|uniref:CU044_2847 family protein n=1 Tax=Streptomyces sp. ND04-05B TaxID=3028693 RepID=UPI0029B36ABB|nr:CU044_2847 family protein [Streptomyces sp. ND04-05B]MDX3068612.1 CU044_2847 family protein [Streptomyces sp. ND04-05B]
MDGLVEFETEDGAVIRVEPASDLSGSQLVADHDGGVVRATRTFDNALGHVRSAARSALRVLRDDSLAPDSVELEFGVKLSAEAGAVIAKSTVEAHLVVRLSWSPRSAAGSPETPLNS